MLRELGEQKQEGCCSNNPRKRKEDLNEVTIKEEIFTALRDQLKLEERTATRRQRL